MPAMTASQVAFRNLFSLRLFPVFLFLLPTLAFSQIAFSHRFFGGAAFDFGKKVLLMPDGSLVMAGDVQSTEGLGSGNMGKSDVVIFRFATQGIRFWQLRLGGSGTDELTDFVATRDGGFLMTGVTDSGDGTISFANGRMDAWVAKISADGQLIWSKTFGGYGDDRLNCVLETSDGRILVGGESGSNEGDMRSSRHGGLDSWLAKLDANGSMIWERHYGGSRNDNISKLLELPSGEYLAIHASDSYDGDVKANMGKKDVWVTRLNDFGEITWQANFGGEDNDEAHDATLAANGDLVLAGTTFSTTGHISGQKGLGDFWVCRISPTGEVQWSRNLGGEKPDGANAIKPTPDGGFVVCGITKSISGDIKGNRGYFDGWVIKVDSVGKLLWTRALGSEAKDALNDIAVLPKGGFLLAGSSELSSGGSPLPGHKGASDFWLCNLGDPQASGVRPYVTPPVLAGKVFDQDTKQPISASIILSDNKTLDSIAVAQTRPDGSFAMLLPAYGLISINAITPGYLFQGEDLLMDTLITTTGVTREIFLSKIKIGSSLVLRRIYFDAGKWDLLPASNAELERVLLFLKLNPRVVIQISGHTDNTGNKDEKIQLSINRANAVKAYLVARGVMDARLKVKGYGMYRPIAPNTTEAGRQQNRRVEFQVLNM